MSARPIPSREYAASFSVSNSTSVAALLYYLNNITPEDLHDHMLTIIQTQRVLPYDVETLAIVLAKMGLITEAALVAVRDQAIRHCARCHQTYMERNNGIQACVVQHSDPYLLEFIKPGANVEIPANVPRQPYYFICCNKMGDVASKLSTPHFMGRHTTIADNVEYNALNVLSCEQSGCDTAHSNLVAMTDLFVSGFMTPTATGFQTQSEAIVTDGFGTSPQAIESQTQSDAIGAGGLKTPTETDSQTQLESLVAAEDHPTAI